jgi:phospholipid/cholesterol/gamma-HCH transport system ATP-binding protein
MSDPLYVVRGLRKRYDDRTVLDGIDFEVGRGECLVILGRSGSGKSVTLRQLNGLEKPDAGSVVFDGIDLTKLEERELYPLRRRIGMLFQSGALFDSLNVFENVAFPLREHTSQSLGEITDRVHRFLGLVGLPGTDDLLPAELSGGMRKRVGIARALVMEPEVVFFDEPTAGLDPTNARVVAELIATLRTGVCDTAIVVTHDLEFADMVADRMAILHHGRFADVGTPAEIHRSASQDVQKFLAGELRET